MKSCSAILVYMRTIVISMIWRETSWRPTSSSSALHFSLDKKKVAATLRDAVPLFSSPYPTPPLIPSLDITHPTLPSITAIIRWRCVQRIGSRVRGA